MTEVKGCRRREFFRLAGMSAVGAGLAAGCADGPVSSDDRLAGGEISFDRETDVLIIGAGGAGLWAAYAATEAGVGTVVVDKAPTYGGDTILSCGVLPVHGTRVQEAQGVEDKGAEYWWDKSPIYSTGDRVPRLREISFTHSAKCIDIWTEKLGVEWMPFEEGYTYYFHVPAPGMGNVNRLLAPLFDHVKASGADFLFDTRALSFILDAENRVVGTRVRDEVSGGVSDIRARKILLATGDFIANQEKVARNLPQWSMLPTTTFNSMGEGLDMALAVGASLENMELPANLTSDNAAVVVWGYWDPVIHVTPMGDRFVNENHGHDVAGALHETGFLHWYCIFDDQLVSSRRAHSVEALMKLGRVHRAHTLDEIAALTKIPGDRLRATVNRYNVMCETGEDPDFGRTLCLEPLSPPYYAAYAVPVRYKTNGGLRIDETCRVIDAAGRPIANVFAAGSCSGTVSPNVAPVVASGLYAGEQMVEALRAEG
jgi:succinate dehydrogenase/fumarate reductase flavoprotein subunit